MGDNATMAGQQQTLSQLATALCAKSEASGVNTGRFIVARTRTGPGEIFGEPNERQLNSEERR
jgi:hypothetical protein